MLSHISVFCLLFLLQAVLISYVFQLVHLIFLAFSNEQLLKPLSFGQQYQVPEQRQFDLSASASSNISQPGGKLQHHVEKGCSWKTMYQPCGQQGAYSWREGNAALGLGGPWRTADPLSRPSASMATQPRPGPCATPDGISSPFNKPLQSRIA